MIRTLNLVAAVLALGLAATTDASALTITNPTISPGISKSNQNDPLNGDLSSSLGHKVELTLKFEFGADAIQCGNFDTPVACSATTGRVTATLKNVSDVGVDDEPSNITAFGLSLIGTQAHKQGPNDIPASGLFQSVLDFQFDGSGCFIDGCAFDDATAADGNSPSEISGFLNGEIDLGADRQSGNVNSRSITATATQQESGTFIWLVAGDFASLCSDGNCTTLAVNGSSWASLIDPQFVECEGDDCVNFNAFWGVHVQGLADSDKLGGASLNIPPPPPPGAPEPMTLALVGLGLVGMGALRRRLRTA